MQRYEVIWAQRARDGLASILDYLLAESAESASAVLQQLESSAAALKSFPKRGRIVPELRWHGVVIYRELIERPWRIIYRIEAKAVLVVSLLEGRRALEDILLERLLDL